MTCLTYGQPIVVMNWFQYSYEHKKLHTSGIVDVCVNLNQVSCVELSMRADNTGWMLSIYSGAKIMVYRNAKSRSQLEPMYEALLNALATTGRLMEEPPICEYN